MNQPERADCESDFNSAYLQMQRFGPRVVGNTGGTPKRQIRPSPALLPPALRQPPHELAVRHDVPLRESTGLLQEAVEPLEAAALHPGGGHFFDAGVEVECRADAKL